jgi:hypothetical protein
MQIMTAWFHPDRIAIKEQDRGDETIYRWVSFPADSIQQDAMHKMIRRFQYVAQMENGIWKYTLDIRDVLD